MFSKSIHYVVVHFYHQKIDHSKLVSGIGWLVRMAMVIVIVMLMQRKHVFPLQMAGYIGCGYSRRGCVACVQLQS